MAKKLPKSDIPGNGLKTDFQCFGPVASKDGDFEDSMLADLGCFKQGKVDSNKYYHAAVVQSKSNGKWYAYFEWGRTGNSSKPQFQFVECLSKEEAQREFSSQLHSKNDKRGRWVNIGGINTLEAKPGKDVYLVREQAARTTGLPDAKNITSGIVAKVVTKKVGKKISIQPEVATLLRDINVGTIAYARSTLSSNDIPTQKAVDEGREILEAARIRISTIGHNIEKQSTDRELVLLTNTLYSRIPKHKKRGAAPEEWILSANNVDRWNLDLDAYESALGAVKVEETDSNPYGDLPVELVWLGNYKNPLTEMAKWICKWMPHATRSKHSYLGNLRIMGIWEISRKDGLEKISEFQKKYHRVEERPLFQKSIQDRPDLSPQERKIWWNSNTSLLFHGSRSCNVRGILHSTLRLPQQLVGVATTAAMFGHGLYFADDWGKSVGYTSHPGAVYARGQGAISGRNAFMFLGDVVLGNIYVAEKPAGFIAPPSGHDSVMGKGGHTITRTYPNTRRLLNNEYIVYNQRQNVLRYLVEFSA